MPFIIGGSILGGAGLSAVGSWLSGREAKKGAKAGLKQAQAAAEYINPAFMGQYGGVTMGPDGMLQSSLNISPTISGAGDPRMGTFRDSMMEQALRPNITGLTGQQTQNMDAMQGLSEQMLAQAGPLGQFQAPEFDVEAAAQKEFGLLSRLMEPAQQRERAAQEQRLFAQGRIGSSGGMMQQRALGEAQEQQRLQAAQSAIASGRAAQQQMFQQAAQGYGMGMQRQQQMFGQGMMAGQIARGLQEQQRALDSPERRLALQAEAGRLGMSTDQLMQARLQQGFQQQMALAGMEQGMLGQAMAAQQNRASLMAGAAPMAAQAAQSPGMMALSAGLGGLGGGLAQAGMMGLMGGGFGGPSPSPVSQANAGMAGYGGGYQPYNMMAPMAPNYVMM